LRRLDRSARDRPTAHDVLAALVGEGSGTSARRPARVEQLVVGRGRELAALQAAFETAREQPTVVTVTGIPGIGKSTLVASFLERVRGDGIHAYHGRCLELESVPFKGIDGAIDMMCNALSRRRYDEAKRLAPDDLTSLVQMFPVLKRVEAFSRAIPEPRPRSPQEARDAASRALRQLLGKLANDAPVVLFIDDLHWTSDDSVQLLLDLWAAPPPRSLLVVAYRTTDAADAPVLDRFTAGLAALGITPIGIDVGPLDHDAIERWIEKHEQIEANRMTAEQALRETSGHPHLLTRLLELGGTHADGPVELATVLAAELAQLDHSARALLDVISIAGGPIRPQAAFDAAGIPRDLGTLDHLRRRKLIQGATSDTRVEAYHDRVREIALAALAGPERQRLHLALAEALERTDVAEPDVLARHYGEGGDRERSLTWTLRAAERASGTFAFARAVELFRAAATLAATDEVRLDVLAQLADAQVQRGLRGDAAQTCLDAAALARALGRTGEYHALRAKAGEHFLLAGQLEHGFDLLRDALAAVEVTLPQSAAVAVAESFNVGGALAAHGLVPADAPRLDDLRLTQRVDLELAVARSLTQIDLRGPLMAARGLRDALQLGEPRRIQRALSLFVLNHAARMPDDPLLLDAEAMAHALATSMSDDVGVAWAEVCAGIHAIYRHELVPALAALAEAERRFLAQPGYAREAALARLGTILVCGNYGVDLAYAARRHAGYIDEMLARGDVFSATWGRFVQILNELAAGNPQQARALVETVMRTWPDAKDSLLSASLLIHSVAIELYEHPERALDALVAVEPEYHQMFSSMIPVTMQLHARVAANCAMAAFFAGRTPQPITLARIDGLLARLANQPLRAIQRVIEGHRHLLVGDRVASLKARDDAADIWRADHQPCLEHSVRLRSCELRGDDIGARAAWHELVRLGLGDPARYATVYAGPLPTTSRR
jgi:hypothetical protein